jgi:hypothetical protein
MTKPPMSSTPDESRASEEPHNHPRPTAAIQGGVLASLGRPPGLYRVAAVPLWLNYYRVNVLVGTDPTAVEIAHSYFVAADEAGRILTATPPLTRLYQ